MSAVTLLLTSVLLIGAGLRIALLTDNRFHPDEALFATLGRLIVQGIDPWLSQTSLLVDKPPLFYYLLASGVSISWACEATARLPGLWMSVIGLALVARLARQIWRSDLAAALALLFCALSPFAILFSPTAFADPIMVTWWLAALVAVSGGRWVFGGLLYGLALATKQNALFCLPLVIGLGVVRGVGRRNGWWGVLRFALGLGTVLALIVAWEVKRGPAVDFWAAGLDANNPGRLIRSGEVWPRAVAWLGYLRYLAGTVGGGVASLLILLLTVLEWRRCPRTQEAASSLLLLAFGVGYLGFHWLVAFPTLDRYLLPLVPVVGLLIGRAGQQVCEASRSWQMYLGVIAVWAALMIGPAWQAAHSAYPVGGDHGAFDGIEQVAEYLRTLPEGTVVYYQSLGWTLHYYLFDAYLYLAPFDSPAALQNDLEAFGSEEETQRYLVLSGWESHIEVLAAAKRAGYRAEPVLETHNRFGERSFNVYQLRP